MAGKTETGESSAEWSCRIVTGLYSDSCGKSLKVSAPQLLLCSPIHRRPVGAMWRCQGEEIHPEPRGGCWKVPARADGSLWRRIVGGRGWSRYIWLVAKGKSVGLGNWWRGGRTWDCARTTSGFQPATMGKVVLSHIWGEPSTYTEFRWYNRVSASTWGTHAILGICFHSHASRFG